MARIIETRLKSTKANKQRGNRNDGFKSIIMTAICKKMEDAANNLPAGKKYLPHGFIKNLVIEYEGKCDFVTKSSIKSAFHRFKNKKKALEEEEVNNTSRAENSGTGVKLVGKTGRPSGSTIAYMQKRKDDITKMNLEIATTLKKMQDENREQGIKKISPGKIGPVVAGIKKKYHLEAVEVNMKTIYSRIQRGILKTGKHGPNSPLHDVELLFVDILNSLDDMNIGLTPSESTSLMNSMMTGKPSAKKLEAHQRKYCKNIKEENYGKIGPSYFRSFLKRHSDKIESSAPCGLEDRRAEWCTYNNISAMYERIYKGLVDAGVAKELDVPIYCNREGEQVATKEEANGRKVTHKLLYPEMGIHFDEVSSNTAQKGDKKSGKERTVGRKGKRKQKKQVTNDFRWTTMPITDFTGRCVMCLLIFKGKPNFNVAAGVDMFKEIQGSTDDDDFFLMNTGPGTLFPGGPRCIYRGKEVPCMIRWSKNASINGEILRDMLREIDTRDLMERSKFPGVTPYFVCDCHGSRLDLGFLTYIHNPNNLWRGFIGLPNGTGLWQTHDSEENNGAFSNEIKQAKKVCVEEKRHCGAGVGIKVTIDKEEAIVLLNNSFEKSFCNEEKNRGAISDRGWNPLNRALLCKEELTRTAKLSDKMKEKEKAYYDESYFTHTLQNESENEIQPKQYAPVPCAYPLQFREGYSKTVLVKMVDIAYYEEMIENSKKRHDEGFSTHQKIMKLKKLTGGTIFKAGESELGISVLEKKCSDERKKSIDRLATAQKQRSDKNEKIGQYNALRASMKETGKKWKELTVPELRILVSVKRKKRGDGKMPTTKDGLKELYERYYIGSNRRSTPNASPENSDNEIDNGETRKILAAENILAYHYGLKGETFHAYKNVTAGNYTVGVGDESSDEESQAEEV